MSKVEQMIEKSRCHPTLNSEDDTFYFESKKELTQLIEAVREEERTKIMIKGLDFPSNERELKIFEEAHKDFEHKLDSSLIDPQKILDAVSNGRSKIEFEQVKPTTEKE